MFGNASVHDDVLRLLGYQEEEAPKKPQQQQQEQTNGEDQKPNPLSDPRLLCGRLFTTCYMPAATTSIDTRRRAADLAKAIGSNHLEVGGLNRSAFYPSY